MGDYIDYSVFRACFFVGDVMDKRQEQETLTEAERRLLDAVRRVKAEVRHRNKPSTIVIVFHPNGLAQVFQTVPNGAYKD